MAHVSAAHKQGARRAAAPALALATEWHSANMAAPAPWLRRCVDLVSSPRIRLVAALVISSCFVGVLGGWALGLAGVGAPAPAPVVSVESVLVSRVAAMEQRLLAAELALEARESEIERVSGRAEAAVRLAEMAMARPQLDGFVSALLNLQMAVKTSRPWHRELRVVLELDGGRSITPPVLEVLSSHSLRGVPTEAELRERFLALAPAIAWRMPADGDVMDRALVRVRAGLSEIGLVSAPAPGAGEAAIAVVAERIRRGDLAGAVSDASALDKRAEPLLAGWAAQARARLAVEQAIGETILSVLARH